MTSKEAVNLFKQYHWKVEDKEKALEILDELVERDTPMQVNSYAGSIFREYKCQCGQHFNKFYHLVEINFCPKCGQRLDWS